ncbi:MAG: hypothetical protein LC659_04720 [Myxococcales bacterium]|nr:hypothetical protein [Myxococcales bacterium]
MPSPIVYSFGAAVVDAVGARAGEDERGRPRHLRRGYADIVIRLSRGAFVAGVRSAADGTISAVAVHLARGTVSASSRKIRVWPLRMAGYPYTLAYRRIYDADLDVHSPADGPVNTARRAAFSRNVEVNQGNYDSTRSALTGLPITSSFGIGAEF